jgi:hypothetical protein
MTVEGTISNMTTGVVAEQVPAPVAAPEPVTQPVPEPIAEKPVPPKADRFAALARKEQEVFRKQQAVRHQQAILAQQAEEIRAFQAAKQQALANPLDALKQLGLSYEDITKFVLNDNQPTPELETMSLRREIDQIKRQTAEERERSVREQREMMEREQQVTIAAFREEVNDYVGQHKETYELTNIYGSASLVSDVIEEHYNEQLRTGVATPKLLTIPEAAKLVEEHLENEVRKAQVTKKFAATQQEVASPQGGRQAQVPKIGPTLSNDLSASVTGNSQRPRTEAERVAAALARLEGR